MSFGAWNQNIEIQFMYNNLGTADSCLTGNATQDVFRVLKNIDKSILFECGDVNGYAGRRIINTGFAESLLFELESNDDSPYGGFLLRFSSISTFTIALVWSFALKN